MSRHRLQTMLVLVACAVVTLNGCDGAARGEEPTPSGPGVGVPTAADLAGRGETDSPAPASP